MAMMIGALLKDKSNYKKTENILKRIEDNQSLLIQIQKMLARGDNAVDSVGIIEPLQRL